MRYSGLFRLVIALQLAVMPPLLGQGVRSASGPARAWVTVGLGGGNAGSGGFAGAAGFDVLSQHHLLSLRATTVSVLFDDDFWDVGLLYGRTLLPSRGLVAASGDLALMGGQRCGGFLGSTCNTVRARVGVPVAVRAAWNATRYFGIGIYTFADINGEQSFAGAALTIQLGRVR